ncbi:MAG: iron-sulfur cluster repair di-iron protein, ric [Lactimicrobium sp.]|uniref:iron-sulfur cluster repair di-iron protein, ric n=1 Tax=Lactimicrobium sp. TaxID=2563780 RepID=UPI002F3549F0
MDLYTNAITKAHGAHHPEVFEVRKIYQQMAEKLKAGNADLSEEFRRLREITDNYSIPSDACGTLAATYEMLKEMDSLQ